MLTFVQAVFVALISGVSASIITTWLKNRYDRQNKLQEEVWKRESWLLDKQAQATVDVLEGLDGQLKLLTAVLKDSSAVIQRTLDAFGSPERTPMEDETERILELIKSLVTKHNELRAVQASWFTSEAKQLSLWFPESLGLEKRLDHLNAKFSNVREESKARVTSVSIFPQRANVTGWRTEKLVLELYETGKRAIRKETLVDLVDELRIFRQSLFENLQKRPEYQASKVEEHGDAPKAFGENLIAVGALPDSLTVKAVRWLERLLRR